MAAVAARVADETTSPGTTAIWCLGLCWMNLMMPAHKQPPSQRRCKRRNEASSEFVIRPAVDWQNPQ